MAVLFHQHDGPVNGAAGGHDQAKILPHDAEAPHGIIGSLKIEDLFRRGTLDAAVHNGQQPVIHFLHDGVVHRHPLQHAAERVQPHAAGDVLAFFLALGAVDLLRLPGAGRRLRRGFGRGGLQIDGGGDVVQAEPGLVLLGQPHFLQNAAGLIVRDDAGARLHILQIAFADAAQLGHLLQCHVPAQALGMQQISQTAHRDDPPIKNRIKTKAFWSIPHPCGEWTGKKMKNCSLFQVILRALRQKITKY